MLLLLMDDDDERKAWRYLSFESLLSMLLHPYYMTRIMPRTPHSYQHCTIGTQLIEVCTLMCVR